VVVSSGEIVEFARDFVWPGLFGRDPAQLDCRAGEDLFEAFGLIGDDGEEFLVAFADRYHVDLSGFLWRGRVIGACFAAVVLFLVVAYLG
jgi:hypothetical protein